MNDEYNIAVQTRDHQHIIPDELEATEQYYHFIESSASSLVGERKEALAPQIVPVGERD